jgi:hypothetical protein
MIDELLGGVVGLGKSVATHFTVRRERHGGAKNQSRRDDEGCNVLVRFRPARRCGKSSSRRGEKLDRFEGPRGTTDPQGFG